MKPNDKVFIDTGENRGLRIRCPVAEAKAEKQRLKEMTADARFTVKQMFELYFQEYIEDRKVNGKTVAGASKK